MQNSFCGVYWKCVHRWGAVLYFPSKCLDLTEANRMGRRAREDAALPPCVKRGEWTVYPEEGELHHRRGEWVTHEGEPTGPSCVWTD